MAKAKSRYEPRHKPGYKPAVAKPLSEVLAERKEYYLREVGRALDAVYKTNNFGLIEKFERAVVDLSRQIVQGKLERLVLDEPKVAPKDSASEVVRRARRYSFELQSGLPYEKYEKLRDKGWNNEIIRKKYGISDGRSLMRYWMRYAAEHKKKEKQLRVGKKVPQDKIQKQRPRLTSYQYAKARDKGMTNDDIRIRWMVESGSQLGGFAKIYNQRKKGVTEAKEIKEHRGMNKVGRKKDTRNLLTYEDFERAMDQGLSNNQIRMRFRLKSQYQLGGFSTQYKRRKGAELVKDLGETLGDVPKHTAPEPPSAA